MRRLENDELKFLLKEGIVGREIIDDSSHGRIIEKVTIKNYSMFVKYGVDDAIRQEIEIYHKFLTDHENLPVPQMILGHHLRNECYIIALEWIEGFHPHFNHTKYIEPVFRTLGKWAADWNIKLEDDGFLKAHSLSYFNVLEQLITQHQQFLYEIIEESLTLLKKCFRHKKIILDDIQSMPITLNPGDLSLHNIILDQDDNIFFIDFESCSVTSMVSLVEHLGQNYESIPHKSSHVKIALQSYLAGWNDHSTKYIHWDNFFYSQICARIYYNLGNFVYWIERIVKNINPEETLEWIKEGNEQLYTLLDELEGLRAKKR